MKEVQTIAVTAEDGEVRLDRWLRRRFPHLTQGQIEKLVRTGQVRVDGARAKANERVSQGQMVRVPPLPDPSDAATSAPGLSPKDEAFVKSLVIYRDADMIALNKPAGLAVQGGTKTARHLDAMLPGLKFELEEGPKLVHRLDRDTSGVLLLGRNPAATAALTRSFRDRSTRKIYWAVTAGVPRPAAGEIRGWMIKAAGPRDGDRELVRAAAHGEEGAQFAITDYVVVSETAGQAAWVTLKPVTGRTHQLRFHMAEAGAPILGDPKYGGGKVGPGGFAEQLHLHARAIEIPQPTTGKPVRITAALPTHMRETFDTLGFDERDAKDAFAAFA